ncbi:ribosomal RNA small subunit methyltransferase A [Alphaproteobacteria bacterium]|nr:ribosomal RNA small subunit methyltransferase A [Alphaproteobacteria bacterium]
MPQRPGKDSLRDASLFQVISKFDLLKNKKKAKRLGQNFLTHPRILDSIVKAAGPLDSCVVVEIGPGPGGLTRAILEAQPRHLFALEKDEACVAALQDLVQRHEGLLTVRCEDAVDYDWEQSLSAWGARFGTFDAPSPIKIIANLPYNVGTFIFLKWLPHLSKIDSLVLMFQKEVADRILAQPNTPAYGRLSILSQYLTKIEKVMTLAPGAFTPAPKVSSTVLRFVPRKEAKGNLLFQLSRVTQVAFQNRRKMIRKSLGNLGSDALGLEILKTLGLDEQRRPETLSVEDFVSFAQHWGLSSNTHGGTNGL